MREPLQGRAFVGAICVLGLIENGEYLEVLGMGNRVELMAVALSASHGDPHPNGHGGIDSVDDSDVSELLVVGPTLVVGQCVAMERGRNELFVGGIGQ